MRLRTLAIAAGLAVTLAACQRGADSGATATANAPGSPGTSVPGATGKGTADASGHSQTAQPGTGLQGGLGASNGTTTMGGPPAHAATDGTTNRTPKGSFGNRP